MVSGLTADLARFATGLAFDALPPKAIEWARTGFTDCVAVMLAGVREPAVTMIADVLRPQFGAREARVALARERAPVAIAAMISAAAAHAMDYDDYAFSSHPSAVLVPALLAVADRHGATGAELVTAYVAGYEVWATLKSREPDYYAEKGWHPTGILGPVAAAAAVARLLRLDEQAARRALSIAASDASGLMANLGTMVKPWHCARCAGTGVTAVRLAQAGMTANETALEHRQGLLHATSPNGRADLSSPASDLGIRWQIVAQGLNVKKHPTVGASQRCIDAAVELRNRLAPDPGTILRIEASVSRKFTEVMPYHRPVDTLQAKFSLEFAVACALVHGRVGLAELSAPVLASPAVTALIEKVRIVPSEDYDPAYLHAAKVDWVRVHLADGRVVSSEPVHRATGHTTRPLLPDQLWAKFSDCLSHAGLAAGARALFDRLQRVETLASAAEIDPGA
jgi:2-methylcitrate dehydratase PrpD